MTLFEHVFLMGLWAIIGWNIVWQLMGLNTPFHQVNLYFFRGASGWVQSASHFGSRTHGNEGAGGHGTMANGGEDGQVWRLHGVDWFAFIQQTLRMLDVVCAHVHAYCVSERQKKSDFEPSKDYHRQGDCILQSVPLRSRAVILPCLCSFECLLFLIYSKNKASKNEAPRHPHRTLIIDPFKTQNYHHGLCQEVEVRYWSQGVLRGNLHQANHSQHWTVQAAGGVRRWWCSAAKRKPVLSSNYKPKHIGFIRQLKEKEFEKPMAHQDAPLALADEEGMTPEPERLGDKALLYLQHYSPYIDRA